MPMPNSSASNRPFARSGVANTPSHVAEAARHNADGYEMCPCRKCDGRLIDVLIMIGHAYRRLAGKNDDGYVGARPDRKCRDNLREAGAAGDGGDTNPACRSRIP